MIKSIPALVLGFLLGISGIAGAETTQDCTLQPPATGPQAPSQVYPHPNYTITRVCTKNTDTECIRWANGHPVAEGPMIIRFIDEDRFCVYNRYTHQADCRQYWPFGKPVINAELKR